MEMNHQLDSENGEGEDSSPQRYQQTAVGPTIRDQEWAQELRRADERSHEIR